jgi:hypothetical protein
MKSLPPQDPGLYPGSGLASLLRANEQQWLFQQQLIVAGQASIAVQLERIKSPHFYPTGASLQIYFTDANGVAADPGAFDFELQSSDIDAAAQYVNMSGLTAVNATFAGRIESPWLYAKYLRVLAKTLTNAVYSNVLATR